MAHVNCYTERQAGTRLNLTLQWRHIMSMMTSQIISLAIVYSTVYSGANQRKSPKLRVTGLCAGNSPVTGEFPAQRASNAKNASIWWRHHDKNEASAYVQPRIPQLTSSDVYMSAPWSLIFRCPSGTTTRVLERKVSLDVSINSLAPAWETRQ